MSTKRITELVRLGKLKRFDFVGRTYVSMREVGSGASRKSRRDGHRANWSRGVANAEGCRQNGPPQFVMEGLMDYEIKTLSPAVAGPPEKEKQKSNSPGV